MSCFLAGCDVVCDVHALNTEIVVCMYIDYPRSNVPGMKQTDNQQSLVMIVSLKILLCTWYVVKRTSRVKRCSVSVVVWDGWMLARTADRKRKREEVHTWWPCSTVKSP